VLEHEVSRPSRFRKHTTCVKSFQSKQQALRQQFTSKTPLTSSTTAEHTGDQTRERNLHSTLSLPELVGPDDTAEANTDPLIKKELVAAQLHDDDVGAVIRMFKDDSIKLPIEKLVSSSESSKRYRSQWTRLNIIICLLCRMFTGKHGSPRYHQIIIPHNLRTEAVFRCHAGMTGGQLGVKKTLDQVQQRFYWTTWKADTARFCRQCPKCAS